MLQLIFGPETEYELIPGETPIEPITEKSKPKPDTKIVITKGRVDLISRLEFILYDEVHEAKLLQKNILKLE